jgi:hypothetical protein
MTPEERQVRIGELQIKFNELDQERFDNNADLARQRGNEFEKLVRSVFKAWGMLRRSSYHTGDNKSEQIDGVLEIENRYALLEVKWEKANLAASELFAFLGKVEGKFIGTIGIFVSRNELTLNFLTALRAGRRQCIVVIHGRDVDHFFDPSFDLQAYLKRHILHVCMSNTCHLSAEKFLDTVKKAKDLPADDGDVIADLINECLKDSTAGNIVNEFARKLTPSQQVAATQRIVNNIPEYVAAEGNDSEWKRKNLELFLQELIKKLPPAATSADTAFFVTKLSRDFQSPYYGPMTEYFEDRYAYLPESERGTVEERLTRQWAKVIDDWMAENRMAKPTSLLWNNLSKDTKKQLIRHFVGFVLSHRRPNHEQYRLARKVLGMSESRAPAAKALREHAKKAAASWFGDEPIDEDVTAKGIRQVKKSLEKMEPYLDDFDQIISDAVNEAAGEHSSGDE